MRGVKELRRRSWTGRVVGKCIFGGGGGCEGMVVGGGRDEGETGRRRVLCKGDEKCGVGYLEIAS